MNNKRPEFVTSDDIKRWDDNIDNDPNLIDDIKNEPIIRELCYAGLYLSEQLDKLECPPEFIFRIQYSAGRASFGHDPWEVHQKFLESYKLNELDFEIDLDNLN